MELPFYMQGDYHDSHILSGIETDVKSANLYIHDFTGHNTTSDVVDNINAMFHKHNINVYIDSMYGDFSEMQKIRNTLINNPKNFNITGILNRCSGPASYLFLSFNKRHIYEDSIFGISNKIIESYGSHHKVKSDILFEQKISRHYDDLLTNYFSKSEIEEIHNGSTIWLDSKDMTERGIATHIIKGSDIIEVKKLSKKPKAVKKSQPKTSTTSKKETK